jgi:hypothetical protein
MALESDRPILSKPDGRGRSTDDDAPLAGPLRRRQEASAGARPRGRAAWGSGTQGRGGRAGGTCGTDMAAAQGAILQKMAPWRPAAQAPVAAQPPGGRRS